jgi:hypothetical protein
METEMYGTYDFFWKRKLNNDKFEVKEKLIETENWFFGHGQRDVWGHLQLQTNEPKVFPFSYTYPIQIDKEALDDFYYVVEKSSKIGLNEKIYFCDYLEKRKCYSSLFHPIFTYYEVRNLIDFGYETQKGFWIMVISELPEMK